MASLASKEHILKDRKWFKKAAIPYAYGCRMVEEAFKQLNEFGPELAATWTEMRRYTLEHSFKYSKQDADTINTILDRYFDLVCQELMQKRREEENNDDE